MLFRSPSAVGAKSAFQLSSCTTDDTDRLLISVAAIPKSILEDSVRFHCPDNFVCWMSILAASLPKALPVTSMSLLYKGLSA